MKRSLLSAVALAALTVGGAAQADLIDSIGTGISRIFGVPYAPVASATVPAPVVSVYTDPYGRRFQVDAAGRYVPLDQFGSYRDQWGRTVYLGANNQPLYVEQNGQVFAYGSAAGTYAMAPSYDGDRDGILNQYDRYPSDPRYR